MSKHHLLILHGWNQPSVYWQPAHQELSNLGLSIHTPDLPGFGSEPLPSPHWSIPDYANWVEQYIQNNILNHSRSKVLDPRLAILGHSFGGRIAAYLASSNPSWLQHLILYAAPVLYRPTLKTRARIAIYKLGKKLTLNQLKLSTQNSELHHADANNLGQVFRNIVPFDQTDRLPLITASTDIIIGTHDTQVRQLIAQESHRLISGSKLHILQGQGHNIHLDNPTLFYGLIRKVLND